MNFEKERLAEKILEKFDLPTRRRDLQQWKTFVRPASSSKAPIQVGIVGKYFTTGKFTLADSYVSVIEAVKHAAWSLHRPVTITWLNAETYERDTAALSGLQAYDAIIVPGGFGSRGVEGKIAVLRYTRTHSIPTLGLCYGMQMMAIEFARHVLRQTDANTTEVHPKTKHAVIDLMPEQEYLLKERHLGGSMRLGSYRCRVTPKTKTAAAYGHRLVDERHRHRYEFQNAYRAPFAKHGMIVAGEEPQRKLVEILELQDHPWYIGTQFHPELQSRPLHPHPLLVGLLQVKAKRRR